MSNDKKTEGGNCCNPKCCDTGFIARLLKNLAEFFDKESKKEK